jgi:foldase protein PrsA
MEENKNNELETNEKIVDKNKFIFSKDLLKKLNTTKAMIVALVLVFIAAGYYFKSSFVVASVNGNFISKASFVEELEKQSGKQVLENMVMEKLVKDELIKQKINVSSDEIETEIKKIEGQVTSQGGTLDQALAQQGLTREELVEQITEQKKLEKLLTDKIIITDEEVQAIVKDNKIEIPKGKESETVEKIREQIKSKKFQEEAQKWVSDLKTNAKIKYYKNY